MRGVVLKSAVGAFALIAIGLVLPKVLAAGPDEASKPEFYTTKVVPVFQANCYRCHGGMNHRGGLKMDSKVGILKGGKDGAVLVPGDPAKSLLVKLIRHEGPADDPMDMPPKKPKLSDADILLIEQWVRAGAVMPEDVPKP